MTQPENLTALIPNTLSLRALVNPAGSVVLTVSRPRLPLIPPLASARLPTLYVTVSAATSRLALLENLTPREARRTGCGKVVARVGTEARDGWPAVYSEARLAHGSV